MERIISKFVAKSVVMLLLVVSFIQFSCVDALATKGDLGEGYNVDNLDFNFTTVDGESVSTVSNGKVKVILFARTNGACYNSNEAISSICSMGWSTLPEIEVLVVDIDQYDAATVKAARDSYDSLTVKFCYDETFASGNMLWNYLEMTKGETNSVTLPVTVIIDKNNKVQYCNTGYTTGKEIYEYIEPLLSGDYGNGNNNQDEEIVGKDLIQVYTEGYYDYDSAEAVVKLTNEARAKEGKSQLVFDEGLTELAMHRAAEQALLYSHTRPNGTKWYTLLEGAYRCGAAENIAHGQSSAEMVTNAWLNSEGHYTNIMNEDYVSIGVGSFTHNGRRFWVQLFSGCTYDSYMDKDGEVKPVVLEAIPANVGEFSMYVYDNELEIGESTNAQMTIGNITAGSARLNVKTDNVVFKSSDESIVTVDNEGNITAISAGEVTITAILDETLVAKADVSVIKQLNGDIDDNRKVDASDALEVLKYAARIRDLSEKEYLIADVEKDNKVDAGDALKILKYAARIIDSLE